MSSTDGNNTAELAVDGDSRIDPKLCARTTNQSGPWLVSDLQAEFLVAGIAITNGGLVLNLLLQSCFFQLCLFTEICFL